jgi:hypothetical protein
MQRYAERWPGDAPLGDALAALTQVTSGTPLPPYVMRSLLFPYLQGERFVEALRRAGGGGWRLVDVALRARRPATTAEILDPDRWLRAERPEVVTLGGVAILRAAGFRRLRGSTLGAEDLAALLTSVSDPLAARELTAGWRGGRYALWRRGPLHDRKCAAPCRRRDALVLAVHMERAPQARALAAALRPWADDLPGDSAAAVHVDRDRTAVRAALAPSPRLARRLVR